jgi:hypothetical protein
VETHGIKIFSRRKHMSILPEGEQMRKAIKWISDARLDDPGTGLGGLIDAACLKFDLSPKDTEVLLNFFTGKGPERQEEK